ncbi:MAG TPA: winged helix-turn-helix transcriptional regulator [Candidatus Thermoplasmatota archaeon]|nr:winged helix-turn-helix transcriptional regulator [Candidatus Thermoplasmatota archaeon]
MSSLLALPEAETPTRAPSHPGRPSGERQRAFLLGLVAANPGLHVLRAANLLGLNWNTCLHHARRLEGERRIVLRKVAGRLCLFDRRDGAVAPRLAPLLLREGRNAEMARLILERPGLNQKGLAAALGVAASVVHRRLLRLEQAGLVDRLPQARGFAVFATPALEAAWSSPHLLPAPAALDDGVPAHLAGLPGMGDGGELPVC